MSGGSVGWKGSSQRLLEFPSGSGETEPAPAGRARLRFNERTSALQLSVDGQDYINVVQDMSASTIINVFTADDFPLAVNGVRQLEPNTLYLVQAMVDIGDSYLLLDSVSVISGVSPVASKITNSHEEFLVRGTGSLRFLQLQANGDNATAVVGDDAFGSGTLSIDTCSIVDSRLAIDVQSVATLSITRMFLRGNSRDVVISGPVGRGQIDQLQEIGSVLDPSYRVLVVDDTAVLGPLKIVDGQFDLSVNGQAVFEFSPNAIYPANTELQVLQNNITLANGAVALAPGSLQKTDPRLVFRGNSAIVDSAFVGSIGFDDNTVVSVIPAVDTYVPVGNGAPTHPLFQLTLSSERFSVEGDEAQSQELVYLGLETITVTLAISGTLERVGGGTNIVRLRASKNGVPVDGSVGSSESNSLANSITRIVPVVLETGDRIQFEIANGTDADNIRVRSARLTLARTG